MRSSQKKLIETLLNNISVGIYIVQEDNSVMVNSQLARCLRLKNHDRSSYKDISSLFAFDSHAEICFENIHRALLTQKTEQISWSQYLEGIEGGSSLWLEVNARHLLLDDQEIILGTVIDVTPYTILSEAMSSSIQTLHLLLDAMEDPIYAVTEDYQVVYGNRIVREMGKMERMKHGWPDDFLMTWPCYKFRGHMEPCSDCRSGETFSRPGPNHWEFFHEYFKIWYAITELEVKLPNVPKRTKLVVGRNITPWKNAEERVRKLSHGLLTAQEAERNRLSRELHDDLSQQLCSINLLFSSIASDIADENSLQKKTITLLNEAMQSSIQTVRNLASGLRPPAFEEKGLKTSLEDHFLKISTAHKLTVHFDSTGLDTFHLDDFKAINLFRIVQEALHNVIKHADAKKVNVQLDASGTGVQLLIQDDGRGFDIRDFAERRTEGKHLGLAGMAERVDILNGEFEIDSFPGKGTKIRIATS